MMELFAPQGHFLFTNWITVPIFKPVRYTVLYSNCSLCVLHHFLTSVCILPPAYISKPLQSVVSCY